jgi:hypothetical protein
MSGYPVNYPFGQGHFDRVQFETCGLISLEGWYSGVGLREFEFPKCFVEGKEIPLFQLFRTYRPDVAAAFKSENYYQGLVLTYRVPGQMSNQPTSLTFNGETIFSKTDFQVTDPAYVQLLDTQEVLHRDHIYGFGPPNPTVIDEIFELAKILPAPILDFGCGSGALVKRLRDEGIEAYGIELERAAIVESILPEVRPFIKLYDGEFPLPYKSGEFQSVFATEVIEHIADYEVALSEIDRITNRCFTITVPDMSSVAICHHNAVVPWHLLESTHVNFFTQTSLERMLRQYFSEVACAKICPNTINDSIWFLSLVGMCRKG